MREAGQKGGERETESVCGDISPTVYFDNLNPMTPMYSNVHIVIFVGVIRFRPASNVPKEHLLPPSSGHI